MEEVLLNILKLNRGRIERLIELGLLRGTGENSQDHNIGESDYSKHIIQPWNIWQEYNLNPWDADIIKRVLRNKKTNKPEDEQRMLDYQKIEHIAQERIRQLIDKIYN